jgi:hypothetical protein
MEEIHRVDIMVKNLIFALIKELLQPLLGGNAKMEIAGRTDRLVEEDIFLIENFLAIVTASPQAVHGNSGPGNTNSISPIMSTWIPKCYA